MVVMLQDDLQAGPALSRINSEGDMEEGTPLPCLSLHPLCCPLTKLTALPSALPSALPLSLPVFSFGSMPLLFLPPSIASEAC